MAQFTQKAIVNTFQDMLEEMPFDKITVSAIVKRCSAVSSCMLVVTRGSREKAGRCSTRAVPGGCSRIHGSPFLGGYAIRGISIDHSTHGD